MCGETVIGKENIVKHASEKHDGKGSLKLIVFHWKPPFDWTQSYFHKTLSCILLVGHILFGRHP